jgi:acetylornithine deacetylase/succinyl-diaminopimelate desuccinylase-like protein
MRDQDGAWLASALAAAHVAIRTRVLRMAAIEAGCPPGRLAARHIEALNALVTRWHGQRWATLPGGVRAMLRCGKLTFAVNVRHAPDEAEAMVGRD